ncbi:MAG: BCCT family transporter [Pseudomonadota bacterium]
MTSYSRGASLQPVLAALTVLSIVAVGFLLLAYPTQVADAIANMTQSVVSRAGTGVLWLCSAALLLSLVLMVGPWGRRRLPASGSGPEFSLPAWLSMLFAAGMGSGLVFWGLAEPLSHFQAPPVPGEGNDSADAGRALALTYLHWGFHAWAVYAVAGLAFAWLAAAGPDENDKTGAGLNLLQGLTGASRDGAAAQMAGGSFDLIALVAVLFGVAGSLANGVDLMQVGLSAQGVLALPGWLLLAVLGIVSLLSAASGLRQGIRLLSMLNMGLAVVLLCWLWVVIDWSSAGSLWLGSIVTYLLELPAWSIKLISADGDTTWAEGWTVVYLLWWIAWTPFVGLFLAGISRGRTVAGYLVGVTVVPVLVSFVWFGAFGAGGLVAELADPGELTAGLATHYTAPLFLWYEKLPGGGLLAWGSLLLLLIFLVTSADSAAWVMNRLGSQLLPGLRGVWGVLMLLVAAALVVRGDVDINKQVAIAGAIPFALVLALQMVALVRTLIFGRSSARD